MKKYTVTLPDGTQATRTAESGTNYNEPYEHEPYIVDFAANTITTSTGTHPITEVDEGTIFYEEGDATLAATEDEYTSSSQYQCRCGHTFPEELGKYGCPNCNGDSGPATLKQKDKQMTHTLTEDIENNEGKIIARKGDEIQIDGSDAPGYFATKGSERFHITHIEFTGPIKSRYFSPEQVRAARKYWGSLSDADLDYFWKHYTIRSRATYNLAADETFEDYLVISARQSEYEKRMDV